MHFEYEKQHCMAFFCHIFQRLSMVLGEKGGWLLYLSCVRCWTAHMTSQFDVIEHSEHAFPCD